MTGWHRCGATVLALLALLGTAALADDSRERANIAAERRAIEARYGAEEAACRERFVVTPCVDAVRARKREALAVPRHQELLLDDAERKRRAALRLQAIEARQAAAASVPAAEPADAAASRPAPPAPTQSTHRVRPPDGAEEAEAAARRVAAAEKRREEAAADRARIAAREAERKGDGKKSAPLPVPR